MFEPQFADLAVEMLKVSLHDAGSPISEELLSKLERDCRRSRARLKKARRTLREQQGARRYLRSSEAQAILDWLPMSVAQKLKAAIDQLPPSPPTDERP